MKKRTVALLHIACTAVVAYIVFYFRGYGLAFIVAAFMVLCLASTYPFFHWRKKGHERIMKFQLEAIKKFKAKLAKEGVVDETDDILKAKRLLGVSDQSIQSQLSIVEDFAEIVKVGERTYAVHQETLTELLDKLPMQDKEINQLVKVERRILDVVLAAGIVTRDPSTSSIRR